MCEFSVKKTLLSSPTPILWAENNILFASIINDWVLGIGAGWHWLMKKWNVMSILVNLLLTEFSG